MTSGPARGQFAKARVFVIDDNPSNVALLVAVLKRAGYHHVFTEQDSRQVRLRLTDVDPDLIILDLHMPNLDGFAVLAQIRGFAPAEALPVLVITADTLPANSERALASGAQDFMTKPFTTGEVLVRTHNLLRARFMHTTLRNSILREREALVRARWLATALNSEQQGAARLRLLDEVKDTLLQSVSHDLRNPIWSIYMMTDLLAGDADGTASISAEMRSSFIARIVSSAQQMERLVSDILDSDPMRSVDRQLDDCAVGDLVRRVLADVDLARDHPLQLEIADVQAAVDPAHLERIVENLLKNARQHLAAGVPVWVKVSKRHDGVILSVEDGGPGVAPDLVGSLFEPFSRRPAAAPTGLGLGLSLVSRFAKLYGGRAWMEDRQGGGASFRVFLPSPHPNRQISPPAEPEPPG